jgi:uncharacterized membrane protein
METLMDELRDDMSNPPQNADSDASQGGETTIRDRWLAAICYLSILVLIPIFASNKSPFLARHCRQGFVLFFCEVVAWLLLQAIEGSVGRIPVLGFLVSILLYLAAALSFLAISVLGFMKALAGDSWRLPFLDDFSDRVPIK